MFSRSTLTRALALPLEQAARPSFTNTALRAYLHQSTATTPPSQSTEPLSASPRAQSTPPLKRYKKPNSLTSNPPRVPIPETKQPIAPTFNAPLTVSQSLLDTLPHLTSQKPHYISAHLHDRPYLVTEGDQLRLPFLMPNVQVGDILRFNRASVLGSRDFTLKGKPYVDERLFECRLRVVGVESEPLRVKEKTKRRRRHVQRITSKHRYTVLRVMEVKIKTVEELQAEGVTVTKEEA
ncbi:mitochondrial 54S ribosomal protein bL21m [Aspergillus stella-maris]|uniref:mitochondrial 54S ribosomal protein bL21m n=1 Tax=Aspergillus stella-maris TaxID=1810926 RepID=UPI003CCE08F6